MATKIMKTKVPGSHIFSGSPPSFLHRSEGWVDRTKGLYQIEAGAILVFSYEQVFVGFPIPKKEQMTAKQYERYSPIERSQFSLNLFMGINRSKRINPKLSKLKSTKGPRNELSAWKRVSFPSN